MAYYSRIAQDAPVYVQYVQKNATVPNGGTLFISDGHYAVDRVSMVFSVAGGAAATAAIHKAVSGQTVAAGVSTMAAPHSLTGTVNTPTVVALTDTLGNRLLAPGDRIGVEYAGTVSPLAGFNITVRLKRVRSLQS